MPTLLKTAAGVTTMWGLASVAILALLMISRKSGVKTLPIIWGAMTGVLILALVPILSWIQLQRGQISTVYRIRVTVLNPQGQPVNNAKIWSSMGGEPKQLAGGWQFDIPVASKPTDSKLTVYAAVENAFWNGKTDVQLANDYNPNTTIQLMAGENAQVRGIVQDEAGSSLEGVAVSVVGYGGETVTTTKGGDFVLLAHAADGQQIELHAEKSGYRAVNQYHPAGREPATLVLERIRKR